MLAKRGTQKAAGNMAKALVSTQATQFSSDGAKPPLTMTEEETKHRMTLPLYDLVPRIDNCWIAPNSTVGKSPSLVPTSPPRLTVPCLA